MNFDEMVRASKRLSRVMIPLQGDNMELKVAWFRAVRPATETYSSRYKFHHHTIFELHATIEGYQDYLFDDGSVVRAQEGDFLLIAPGQVHKCTGDSPDIKTISICFQIVQNSSSEETSEDQDYLIHYLYNQPYALLKQSDLLKKSIELIFQEALQTKPGHLILLRSYVLQGLFEIARQLEEAEQIDWFHLRVENQERTETRVDEVRKYIISNLSLPITCQTIAKHMHLSAKQLNRIVYSETGGSLHDMIVREKHSKAQELLLESDMTIREISEALGYSNEYNFNRFFTRIEGMSPGRFRHARHFTISPSSKEL